MLNEEWGNKWGLGVHLEHVDVGARLYLSGVLQSFSQDRSSYARQRLIQQRVASVFSSMMHNQGMQNEKVLVFIRARFL